MEALLANRKVRRTQLTKICNKIDAALNPHDIEDPPVSLVTLERFKLDAQDKVTLLVEVHEEINQASTDYQTRSNDTHFNEVFQYISNHNNRESCVAASEASNTAVGLSPEEMHLLDLNPPKDRVDKFWIR